MRILNFFKSFFTAKKYYKQKTNVEIILFLILSAFTSLLPLGNISLYNSNINYPASVNFLGHLFVYDWMKAPSAAFFVPIVVVFMLLFIYELLSITNIFKRKTNIIALAILTFYILFRLIATFSFPYGTVDYYFIDYYAHKDTFHIIYEGYSVYERFTSFIAEALFGLYFFFVFAYFKYFDKKIKHLLELMLYALIVFAYVLIGYLVIKEHSKVRNNLLFFIGDDCCFLNLSICSLLSNRNTLGFFLFAGALSSLILFNKTVKAKYMINYFLIVFFIFISWSRTPFIVSAICYLLYVVYFVVFKHKKYPQATGILIAFTAFMIVVLLVNIVFFHDNVHRIAKTLFDFGNVHERGRLTESALAIMNQAYYWMFGYGRLPFINVIYLFRTAVGYIDPTVAGSHNSYVEILINMGIIGLLLVFLLFGFLITLIVKRMSEKKYNFGVYLVILISSLIYSFFEMKMLFLLEGNNIIFMILILYPILYDYYFNEKLFESKNVINGFRLMV